MRNWWGAACAPPRECPHHAGLYLCAWLLFLLHIAAQVRWHVLHWRARHARRRRDMAPYHAILELLHKLPEYEQVEVGRHLRAIYLQQG